VIERTNADPHFVFPDALGLVADLDTLYKHQEEPFGTASIYAQFCVMRLAKENEVTVLMDGQGADELLAGYPFYYQHYAGELKTRDRRTFQQERQARKSLTASSESKVRDLAVQTIPVGLQTRARELRQKLHNAVSPILNRDFFHEYEPTSFTSKEKVPETLNESLYKSCFGGSLEELLRYADRNSMAHSREVRLAFLSPDLAAFLFSLPPHFKIRNGVTKYIMRAAFSDLLPPEIRDRKDKIGYEPPQGQWLKHERIESGMRDAEKVLLDSKTLHPDYKKNLSRFAVSPAYADNNRWKILMAAGLIDSGGGS
jgi:asparagine synthase (glutamine-hydrolysing)